MKTKISTQGKVRATDIEVEKTPNKNILEELDEKI